MILSHFLMVSQARGYNYYVNNYRSDNKRNTSNKTPQKWFKYSMWWNCSYSPFLSIHHLLL